MPGFIRIRYRGPRKTQPESLEKQFKQIIKEELLRGGYEIEIEAKIRCPVDMDRLRSSIKTRRLAWNRVSVGTDVKYARYVEYGTAPHAPPFEPILEWAKRHGIEEAASKIWWKIYHHGTDPHPYLRPAFFGKKPRILKRIAQRTKALLERR